MRNYSLLFVFILIVSVITTAAQGQDTQSLELHVDSLMTEFDQDNSPGGIVGVVKDGDLIFAKGYGMADLTHDIPITTETRFNLASVSKQFTGFAFALLAKRGELSLDDPVRKYLPNLPEFGQTVTLRHLLTHTSGYREFFGPLALVGRKLASREEALKVVQRQPKLEFPPGSTFQYNSSAYVILTEIAERITGKPFPEWMEENVFRPLNMENTTIKREVGEVIPNAAVSYAGGKADRGYRKPSMDNPYYGSADVYTTVEDLAKWLDNFRTAKLGGEAIQEQMRERFVLTSGDTINYSLGLRIDNVQGLRRLHHSGVVEGFRTSLEYYPEIDYGIVVMANYRGVDVGGTARKIAEIVLQEHINPKSQQSNDDKNITVDAELLQQYDGIYRAENGNIYDFETEKQRLYLVHPLMEVRMPLTAVSDTLFHVRGIGIQVGFNRAVEGDVEEAYVHSSSNAGEISLRRMETESWHPTMEELEEYAGRYYSPELEAIYTFKVEDGQLMAEHRWIGQMHFSPVAEDIFSSGVSISKNFPPFRMQIRFERDEDGTVTGYHTSIFRTSGIWFEKKR